MKFPCELIVWKVLPAIRARLAEELVKEGLSQKKIAEIMGLTEAAVSQYINKKRAADFKMGKDFDKNFKSSAKKLKDSGTCVDMIREACSICRDIRKSGGICQLHRGDSEVPTTCKICIGK